MENYNIDFNFKKSGFLYKYIYKYTSYLNNIKIGNEKIFYNKSFTIFLYLQKDSKTKIISFGIMNNKYNKYNLLVIYIYKKLLYIISKFNLCNKDIISLELCIWEFNYIWNTKLDIKQKKEYDKKIVIFDNKINDIINFRFDKEKFNNFKLQLLLKDLKKIINLKLYNIENIEECINHLYYLIKKWKGFNKELLVKWILITIEKHNK